MFLNRTIRGIAGILHSGRFTHPKLNRAIATMKEAEQLQEAAMEENCILVDENDRSIGHGSKRDCHRVGADGGLKLHRAFSVFLFNSDGDMLLQKRSSHKVIKHFKLKFVWNKFF